MKLIQPKAEYLPQSSGVEGIYKHVELAARTCYKSEDKITEDSAKPFVDRMVAGKHLSMLEHGTVYLTMEYGSKKFLYEDCWALTYIHNPYTKVKRVPLDENNRYEGPQKLYVSTNLRVLQEEGWLDDLQCVCEPTEFHEKRYTFRLTTSIGVTREIIRHRHFSFAEQSTRYCNFSKDKFDNQVSFCLPSWVDRNREPNTVADVGWLESVKRAENNYLFIVSLGWQPQQAREVLPLSTASEIVVTGFASDWRHFFDLRLFGKTGKPHPNMQQLAELIKAEAEKAGVWEDIMSKPSKFD